MNFWLKDAYYKQQNNKPIIKEIQKALVSLYQEPEMKTKYIFITSYHITLANTCLKKDPKFSSTSFQ